MKPFVHDSVSRKLLFLSRLEEHDVTPTSFTADLLWTTTQFLVNFCRIVAGRSRHTKFGVAIYFWLGDISEFMMGDRFTQDSYR